MEEKIRKFWNKYKKQTIIAVIVVLSLFKIHSVLSERVNLTPDKVYEINTLPNVCANTKAGGFSDLFFKDGNLYILTDRGPNSEPRFIGDKEVRIFYCPNLVPTIYETKFMPNGGIKVSGKGKIEGTTGLPVDENTDCLGISPNGDLLNPQLSGADTESFIIDKKGNYWIGEEYYPSIIKVNKDFKVEKRFAPINSQLINSKIEYILPEELNSIQKNMGFEAMAYNGRNHIYVFTQSALKGEFYGRIIKFNINTERVEKVYKYDINADSKVSGAVMLNNNTILTVEFRDGIHQIRKLKLNGNKIKSKQVYPLTGLNHIDSDTKIEGIALGKKKLYIINDNDYGVSEKNRQDNFIIEFTLK